MDDGSIEHVSGKLISRSYTEQRHTITFFFVYAMLTCAAAEYKKRT